MSKHADPLSVWTQFPVGALVRIKVERFKGCTGVVHQKLDDDISGFARYAVRIEERPGSMTTTTADYSRCSLARVKVGSGPRKRAAMSRKSDVRRA